MTSIQRYINWTIFWTGVLEFCTILLCVCEISPSDYCLWNTKKYGKRKIYFTNISLSNVQNIRYKNEKLNRILTTIIRLWYRLGALSQHCIMCFKSYRIHWYNRFYGFFVLHISFQRNTWPELVLPTDSVK